MFTKLNNLISRIYIKDLAREWVGFKRWQNDEYLNEIAGDEIIEVDEIDRTLDGFEYFHKIYRRFKLTYREFMQRMNDENRTRNYYFSEYRVPLSLLKDIS